MNHFVSPHIFSVKSFFFFFFWTSSLDISCFLKLVFSFSEQFLWNLLLPGKSLFCYYWPRCWGGWEQFYFCHGNIKCRDKWGSPAPQGSTHSTWHDVSGSQSREQPSNLVLCGLSSSRLLSLLLFARHRCYGHRPLQAGQTEADRHTGLHPHCSWLPCRQWRWRHPNAFRVGIHNVVQMGERALV